MTESLDGEDRMVDRPGWTGSGHAMPIHCGGESLSDCELNAGVAAVVAALTELDVRPDERVLVLILDGPGFAEIFLGVMRQGAVPLTVNPALSAGEIVAVAAETGARLVAVAAERIPELADLEAGPPVWLTGPQGPWGAILRLN